MIPVSTDYSGKQLDLECLQSLPEPDNRFTEVDPSVTSKTPKIVSGPQKLAQRYAVLFTTIIGSDTMDPDFGTRLLDKVVSGNFGGYTEVEFLANTANLFTKERIMQDDDAVDRFGDIPDDEKLKDCWISNVVVDKENRRISIFASILTVAGESITFMVPTVAGVF